MILRTPKVVREKKRAAKEWKNKFKEKTTIISQNTIEKQAIPKQIREEEENLNDLYKLFKMKKDYKVVGLNFYINGNLEAYNFEQMREKIMSRQKKFVVYESKI